MKVRACPSPSPLTLWNEEGRSASADVAVAGSAVAGTTLGCSVFRGHEHKHLSRGGAGIARRVDIPVLRKCGCLQLWPSPAAPQG